MSIEILKPGILTTIAAAGRRGVRHLGIGPSGAMDKFAMNAANFLVGNHEDAATLEMHFPAPEILFRDTHLVSVAGIGFEIIINDRGIPLWKPFIVPKGSIMKFGKTSAGSRAYLSVQGGWKAESWLGSFTTHLNAVAGGHHGRSLQKQDLLETSGSKYDSNEIKILPWGISKNELEKIYFPADLIRCVESAESDFLSRESHEQILSSSFTVTPQSNRMGYRLAGEKIFATKSGTLVSSAVDFGTIQLLPDGNLIILMADHQTTGGYPRIASVIQPDLPKLAQRTQNDKIRFSVISLPEAEAELQTRQKVMDELKNGCHLQHKGYFMK